MSRLSARPRAGSFKSVLFCSAALCVFAASSAHAAEAEAEAADAEIVVNGSRPIAESEAAALEVQKNSDSLVTVAASDSVGRLPDQNIAQATGRLPGVAVERDQGQARYISLRGAPKTWTTLSFDGINVVSPEGRDARFDSVPSAIAKQIVVSKAVTPDMPGETVAGNVNIVTRSAFDYSGFHLAGKAGYGQAEYGKRPEYEGSLVLSDRFAVGGGELGVLVSGSYYERNMITDNFENDWEKISPEDSRPGNETRYWVVESENKLYRLTRKNWSVSGRADWKPDANNTISLRSIYTIFTDDEARDNYRFDMDDQRNALVANTASCSTTVNPSPTTSGFADVCVGNTPMKGTIYGIDIRQRSTLRAFKQSIFTNTLEGTHELAGGWKVNWLGNYTVSKDDRTVLGEASWNSPGTRTLRPTVGYDFSDPGISRLTLYTTLASGSPTQYSAGTQVTAIDTFNKPLGGITFTDAVDTTTAYTGRLAVSRDMPLFGGDATFKAGVQFDQRTKVVDEKTLSLNTAAQYATVGIPTDYNQFSISQPFMGKLYLGYTFNYFDTAKMKAVADAARASFALTPVNANFYDVREQVLAGYVMGTVRYDWGSLIGGVRVERVTNRGIAYAVTNSVSKLITAESGQTMVFPSLHLNYNLDDTKKLRLSFNTGAARADYDQMRPNVTYSDLNQTVSGGNPAVKPERAKGLDAYFEWYVRPQGYISIGAFYKKVSNVLYTSTRSFGSTSLNSDGVDRSRYIYSGIVNGGDGRLYGMEVAAQVQLEPWTRSLGLPDWMGGFGISANLTLNDSEVTKPAYYNVTSTTTGGVTTTAVTQAVAARKVRLPNTSDSVYNVGVYYEKYGLSARLQYQRRSLWLDAMADDDTQGGDTYWDADDELDFSARYAINRNVEVYFDASNLLNQPGRRFSDPAGILTARGTPTAMIKSQTIEWERFGRRFSGGVRVNF
ncbi:TonB-dependent receptor [Novosphingobium flavum]|uniref:TonB-dependent receptor n=1 Tax=Novosphingobium flavum TaxID=1778672 RepID=A0A7X1KMN4_9SPHN|nr:TonB-dependent receptor [Novosphingobium flavum]MBC2666807.1 TonB-dependent receptor [Novosphingobium flavum]